MRELFRRPSPSMVVAVIALIVALCGTAVAGVATISKLSKSEKRKVRGLADQEIDKKAPGLSVKTAGDVTNQIWAVVSSVGNLVRSNGHVTDVSTDGIGRYVVSVDRDIGACYYLASLGGSEEGLGSRGDISVNPSGVTANSVYVLTGNNSNVSEDRNFTLLIRC
jgi:hypothetical protein